MEKEVVVCLVGEYLLWRCLGVVFSVDVLALGYQAFEGFVMTQTK